MTSVLRWSGLKGSGATVARISRWGVPGLPQSTVTAVPGALWARSMTHSEMVDRRKGLMVRPVETPTGVPSSSTWSKSGLAARGISIWSGACPSYRREVRTAATSSLSHARPTSVRADPPAADNPVVRVRLQFVREVLDRRSLPEPVTLTLPRTRQEGPPVVRDFMADHPEVTAVAAFDDDVALRMLAALHDLGVAVPDELAVIGYDDTEYGGLVTPSLTTVHINAEVHGRRAARTALGLDAADLVAAPARVIVRESA